MHKLALTAVSTIAIALSALSTPALAQTAAPAKTPQTQAAPAANNAQDRIIKELALTPDQQTKLVKLQQSTVQKAIAVLTPKQKNEVKIAMQQGKAPALTLSVDQQKKIKAIQLQAQTQQDAILTPQQKLKLQQMRQQSTPQK
jgi:Spy/CpxP family protein refolding chaperone